MLLGELFAAPKAVVAAVLNGLVLNVVALCMGEGIVFAAFIALDGFLVSARLLLIRSATRAVSRGLPTPTDLYLATAALWCALQGTMAFAALQTHSLALQLLSATTAVGLVGPICARNYAAPRFALLLVGLCDLPFVAGAALSGDRWLLVLVLQTPLFLFGTMTIIRRFQSMAVAALTAEQDSRDRARRDPLTGLLNRSGLAETLDAQCGASPGRLVLLYLDLDGFKPINDSFGHEAGDHILQAVARRLQAASRDGDIVSRLGGDEFVIVAPGLLASEASAYAEAIIRRITEEDYAVDGRVRVRVGISVGFACAPEDGLAGRDLQRKADAALYAAKASGRGVQRRFGDAARATVSGAAA